MSSGAFIWILLFVTCMCLIVACLSTVLVFKTSTHTIRALNSAHERNSEHTQGLVDRIVSGDWQTYKAYEIMGDRMNSPGHDTPPKIPDVPVGADRGGFGSRLGLAAMGRRLGADEEEMTEELRNASS